MPNDYYSEIIRELKKFSRPLKKNTSGRKFDLNRYLGTPRTFLNVYTPDKRKVVKEFLKKHKSLDNAEFRQLLNKLYRAKTFDEVSITGILLAGAPEFKKSLKLSQFEKWLSLLHGWAEIDSTCHPAFTAPEVLANWSEWKTSLIKLSKDKNINKRRASLVLLVMPVARSKEKCLADLAFKNIERLKGEKEVLITKAISWLLRQLVHNHKNRVSAYLDENTDSLPKIAIRETRRKIETGKK